MYREPFLENFSLFSIRFFSKITRTDEKLEIKNNYTQRVLSSLNVNERGTNLSKSFQKDNFGTGVYVVSLMINGKSIDAKRIIFN